MFLILSLSDCQKSLTRYSRHRNETQHHVYLNDTTLAISGVSDDPQYGYTPQRPIMMGLYDIREAASNVEKYLNALLGPNGETIRYSRLKACCPFKTKNFRLNVPILNQEFNGKHGMLERYQINYGDSTNSTSIIIYINLYDESRQLLAPKTFTYKKN